LRTKPKVELLKELNETKAELRKATFDLGAGKLNNVRTPRALRKKIARLSTFLNQNG
jgi:ribosomal protein L29